MVLLLLLMIMGSLLWIVSHLCLRDRLSMKSAALLFLDSLSERFLLASARGICGSLVKIGVCGFIAAAYLRNYDHVVIDKGLLIRSWERMRPAWPLIRQELDLVRSRYMELLRGLLIVVLHHIRMRRWNGISITKMAGSILLSLKLPWVDLFNFPICFFVLIWIGCRILIIGSFFGTLILLLNLILLLLSRCSEN